MSQYSIPASIFSYKIRSLFDTLINIWSMQVAEYSVIRVGKVMYGRNRLDNKVVRYCKVSALSYLIISIFMSPAKITVISSGILSRAVSKSLIKCLTLPFGWRYIPPTMNYFLLYVNFRYKLSISHLGQWHVFFDTSIFNSSIIHTSAKSLRIYIPTPPYMLFTGIVK